MAKLQTLAATGTVNELIAKDKAVIGLQLTGTWVGTVTFEASVDGGATWVGIGGVPLVSGLLGASVLTTTANGIWFFGVAGFSNFRANWTRTSGSLVVAIEVHDGPIATLGGTSVLGKVVEGPPATGNAPLNAGANAATNVVVKATPGTLYSAQGFNNKSASQYIQIHDAASLPADTAVPVAGLSQLVPANSPWSFDFGMRGRAFAVGIVICNSSTLATKTLGAADCSFDAQYI